MSFAAFRRLLYGILLAGLAAAIPASAAPLRVMTFNVRYPNPDDGPNVWPHRRALFLRTLAAARPDVMGTQELYAAQGADIVRALPAYAWFGRDRRGLHADEHMGIFYRKDRLRLVRHGDFWLSDTPDAVGSMHWGVDLPRMVNWGIFEMRDRAYRRFVLFDTHFAHRDEDAGARERSAALILSRIGTIANGLPIVLVGDLNARPDSAAYRLLAGALTDVWTASPVRAGPDETFHNFTGRADRRIDYIFVRDFRPRDVDVRTDHAAGRYPSDHFPVVADLDFALPDDRRTPPR